MHERSECESALVGAGKTRRVCRRSWLAKRGQAGQQGARCMSAANARAPWWGFEPQSEP